MTSKQNRKLAENDLVYYFNPRKFVGRSDKWARKYTGPFRVVKMLSPVNALLQKSAHSKPFVAHVDKVKVCYETESSAQVSVTDGCTTVGNCASTSDGYSECTLSDRPKRDIRPPERLIAEC